MLDALERLRRKPIRTRQRIALSVTFVISLLIVTIWWQTFSTDQEGQKSLSEVFSPFSVVGESISSAAGSVKNTFQGLSGTLASSSKTLDDTTISNPDSTTTSTSTNRNEEYYSNTLTASTSYEEQNQQQ